MASPLTHAFFAVAGGKMLADRRLGAKFWILTALCAMAPDVDVIMAALGGHGLWSHRGITHSILASAGLSFGILWQFFHDEPIRSRRWWALWIWFFATALSHVFLDLMVTNASGVMLLAPFSQQRFLLPWKPLAGGIITVGSVREVHLFGMVMSEVILVWLPMSVLLAVKALLRRRRRVKATVTA